MAARDVKQTRRCWMIGRLGSLANLELHKEDFNDPPAAGEVKISVKAIGLNFADVFSCLGLYAAAPKSNFTPGLELCGVVEEVGSGVDSSKVQVGDRVMGISRFGAFVTKICIDHRHVKKVPDAWSFEQGAAFTCQALTAIYGLRELGNLRKGGTVLVHSAAGGVGMLSMQIIAKYGGKVIATVGNEQKKTLLEDKFGGSFDLNDKTKTPRLSVIVRTQGREFRTQMQKSLSTLDTQGTDIVFDSLAGDYFQPGYDSLRPGGRLIMFGAGSLMPSGDLGYNLFRWLKLGYDYVMKRPKLDPMEMIGQNKACMGFNLIYMFDRLDVLYSLFDELQELKLDPPHIGRTFKFDEMREALAFFQSGRSVGKVVLVVDDE
eukprot:Nk52_evm41s296 gene=Nk52_evmTU41s296